MFHCIEYIFWHSEFLSKFALALKNRVCPENFHFIVYNFTFRTFEQLALVLKNRVCHEIFQWIEYNFALRIFEELPLALKNRMCPEIFSLHWNIYHHSGFLNSLCLPWRKSCPEIFHCIEIFFIILDFWATCACSANRVCLENFQAREATGPRLVRLCFQPIVWDSFLNEMLLTRTC